MRALPNSVLSVTCYFLHQGKDTFLFVFGQVFSFRFRKGEQHDCNVVRNHKEVDGAAATTFTLATDTKPNLTNTA